MAAGMMLAVAGSGAQTPAPAEPARSVTEIVQQDLQNLTSKLNDPNARQEDRDEAARRLMSRQTPEARRIVADTLVTLNPGGQLAAVRALADDPNPDPLIVDSLFAALGTNRQLNEAASRALANYKTDPQVVSRLLDYVQRRPPAETTRLPVIRAIGSIPEKRCAQFLLGILQAQDESPAARTAAAAALAELTGIYDSGQDVQRWQQWWEENAAKSDADFRSDLIPRRAGRYDALRQQYSQLSGELLNLLKEQYRAAAAPQRTELLLRFLRSAEPQVRAIAAEIILEEALDNKPPAPVVLEQLRDLVGDSSPPVRTAAADALGTINDSAAFEPLLAQLEQEPDPLVRAALARALGPMNDLRAVPALVLMLSDPSYDAAMAAASGLRKLGPLLQEKDPNLARQTALALRDAMEKRTGTPQTTDLRRSLVDAMVPLRQEELEPLFRGMLDERRGETAEVRQLAVRGIGEIARRESAGVLVAALGDRSAPIRLEAATAMAKNPALPENAEALRARIDPQQEADEAVREAAWIALQTAFPSLPRAQLRVWADRFKDVDPQRRLVALKALAQVENKEQAEDGLATTRIDIAGELMKLKEYKEAAEYFGKALDYKKTQQVPGGVLEFLRRQRMIALLRSKDYAAAVAFAEQTIREDAGAVQLMGGLIRAQVETLQKEADFQGALDLIAAANRMNPPLSQKYLEELAGIERDLQQRRNQQNGAQPPPGPRNANSNPPNGGRSASGGQ